MLLSPLLHPRSLSKRPCRRVLPTPLLVQEGARGWSPWRRPSEILPSPLGREWPPWRPSALSALSLGERVARQGRVRGPSVPSASHPHPAVAPTSHRRLPALRPHRPNPSDPGWRGHRSTETAPPTPPAPPPPGAAADSSSAPPYPAAPAPRKPAPAPPPSAAAAPVMGMET